MESNSDKIEKIDCSNVTNFFGKYFEDKLADKVRIKVLHHLAECYKCRTDYLDFYHTRKSKKVL